MDKVELCHFLKDVDVPQNQRILRNHSNGIVVLEEYLEALPRQLKFALDRLIAIGVAGERHHLGDPRLLAKGLLEKIGSIHLDHNFCLEIQPRRKTEILMGWTCITINASMLTTAIRIDAVGEVEIGAVILRENRSGCIVVENSRHSG
jgi:hypothetical protein